eukprot:5703995-Amphidinium_carterae.1
MCRSWELWLASWVGVAGVSCHFFVFAVVEASERRFLLRIAAGAVGSERAVGRPRLLSGLDSLSGMVKRPIPDRVNELS